MNTFSVPCEIAVLDDGLVTLNIRLSSEDEELLKSVFDGKEIAEDDSLLNVACLSDGGAVPMQSVVISGLLKLQNKQQAPYSHRMVRIANVVFLGQCSTCDSVVNISDKLPFEQKKKFVASYGVELKNGVLTCKHILSIDSCPNCHP